MVKRVPVIEGLRGGEEGDMPKGNEQVRAMGWLAFAVVLVIAIGCVAATAGPAAGSASLGAQTALSAPPIVGLHHSPVARIADCRYGYHGGPGGVCVPDKSQKFKDAMDRIIKAAKKARRFIQWDYMVVGGGVALANAPVGLAVAAAALREDNQWEDFIDKLQQQRDDPPDRNYTVLAHPVWTTVRKLPPGLSPSGTRAVLLWINRYGDAAATLQALTSSNEKAQGAYEWEPVPYGGPWFHQQVRQVVTYSARLATLLDGLPATRAGAAAALRRLRGVDRRISRAKAEQALARLKRSGPPRSLEAALKSMGMSSSTIARQEQNALRAGFRGIPFPISIIDNVRLASMDRLDRQVATEIRGRAKWLEAAGRLPTTITLTTCPAATVTPGSHLSVAGRLLPAVKGSKLEINWYLNFGGPGTTGVDHAVTTDAAGAFSDSVTVPSGTAYTEDSQRSSVGAFFSGDATRLGRGAQCEFLIRSPM